ncbi:hypothetical protein CMV_018061 [Castanea mollissima]|uniref:Uncharacterized protein n=1 Tax=Castanea mollissima TaxID=60419 RepID=A0A8J4VD13_9ROSI|nr:hypothetical protein CMV_018061 [Castanea mollissima]
MFVKPDICLSPSNQIPSKPKPNRSSPATIPVLSFTSGQIVETQLELKSAPPDTAHATLTRIGTDLQTKRRGTASTLTALAEACEAELWFESAKEYPPSPFVTKLVKREDILLENVNTSPKPKNVESTMESDVGVGRDFCALDVNNKDEVFSFMRSKKRLREEAGNGPSSTSEFKQRAAKELFTDLFQNIIPSARDPTIWKVKCMVGRERNSAFCLMQKYVDLKSLASTISFKVLAVAIWRT